MQMHSTEERSEAMKSQKQHGVISIDQDYQSFSNSGSRATLAALVWAVSLCSAAGWGSNILWWCCAFVFVPCPNAEHAPPPSSKLLSCTESFSLFLLPLFPEHFWQIRILEASGTPSYTVTCGHWFVLAASLILYLFCLCWYFVLDSLPFALSRIIQCKAGKENVGFSPAQKELCFASCEQK